jgi:hypothetical protein
VDCGGLSRSYADTSGVNVDLRGLWRSHADQDHGTKVAQGSLAYVCPFAEQSARWGHGQYVTEPVCVALNVLPAEQPPKTIGSR